MKFLSAASTMAKTVYSLHKTSTREVSRVRSAMSYMQFQTGSGSTQPQISRSIFGSKSERQDSFECMVLNQIFFFFLSKKV